MTNSIIEIKKGWNIIGCTFHDVMSISDFLSSNNDLITQLYKYNNNQNEFEHVTKQDKLEYGTGYWMYATKTFQIYTLLEPEPYIIYPENEPQVIEQEPIVTTIQLPFENGQNVTILNGSDLYSNWSNTNTNNVFYSDAQNTVGQLSQISISGHNTGQGQYIYCFVPTKNMSITINFTGYGFSIDTNTNFDTVLAIYNFDNEQLAYNDDGGDGYTSMIQNFIFRQDTFYSIVVTGYYPTSEGNFLINFLKGNITDAPEVAIPLTADMYNNAPITEPHDGSTFMYT